LRYGLLYIEYSITGGNMAKKKAHKGAGSLYQRPGSPFYWMAYTDPHGAGFFRESTGRKTKGEAQAVLTKRIAALQSGEDTARSGKVTVGDLYKLVLTDYALEGQETRDVEQRWRDHLEPYFAKRRASNVTYETLAEYAVMRRKEVSEKTGEPTSPSTVNRELAILRRAFRLGKRSRKVGIVPDFPMTSEKGNEREGFLSDAERFRLAQACDAQTEAPFLRAIFETAVDLGARKGELLDLQVTDVNFTEHEVTFRETKNGDDRTVPMTPNAEAWLAKMTAGKSSDASVFTWSDGRPVRDFREQWVQATEAAGVANLLFHDLRRTAVRNLRKSGVSEGVAMAISGHKTRSVFERYNIKDRADLHDAVRRVEAARLNAHTLHIGDSAESGEVA
jgi:integrase